MKGFVDRLLILSTIFLTAASGSDARGAESRYDPHPPFGLGLLAPTKAQGHETVYNPKNPYNIFINYELGMHCVGFDLSYCCIIPPYNSIEAQAVRSGEEGARPRLLSPADQVAFHYTVRDNSYSEGNKMRYWHVPKDVDGDGTMSDPDDNLANYVWTHLFIYKDLEGTIPAYPKPSRRKRLGREIPIDIDSGPTGKPLAGGSMDYAGEKGGNIVFTDSLLPEFANLPVTLTPSFQWDALGLPLTAFNDSRRKGSIRTVTNLDFQPYQYATVELRTIDGRPLKEQRTPVKFFGTEPIDISNCAVCHSGQGIAAMLAREAGLTLFDKEYEYWNKNYPDTSEYMARLTSASILILELHDRRHGTGFLKYYDPDASTNRLGRVGPVNCVDCHGDNISVNLQTPRPGVTGYPPVRGMPFSEAIHSAHARLIPMPDAAGRTQSCQACHPSHWQEEKMNESNNPYRITDDLGNPRFSHKDLRAAGGGCFLRRDAHSNPRVQPPFFLNDIGRWYLTEVSMKDEKGDPVAKMRGLYCTDCHNHLSLELYRSDDLENVVAQEGKTLRNRSISEVVEVIAGGDEQRFKSYFADPVVGVAGDPLFSYYADHKETILAKAVKTDGGFQLRHWNDRGGEPLSYKAVSGGNDWWLSPAEPHCANCHVAPFVESGGGKYFPIDQPGKYALFRYSKAHGRIACQSCHQSMHGLYPVRHDPGGDNVDETTHQQALQFSPDGKYAGPVACPACHTVNKNGVPTQLKGTPYYEDYWAAVVLIHFMRDGDQKMPLTKLMKKYPYPDAEHIVRKQYSLGKSH